MEGRGSERSTDGQTDRHRLRRKGKNFFEQGAPHFHFSRGPANPTADWLPSVIQIRAVLPGCAVYRTQRRQQNPQGSHDYTFSCDSQGTLNRLVSLPR